jgi:hypothetical protein
MLSLIHNLLTLFAVLLVFVALGTLLWFLYFFVWRRIMRARRIANIRFRRLMTERETEHDGPGNEESSTRIDD